MKGPFLTSNAVKGSFLALDAWIGPLILGYGGLFGAG